MGLHHDYTARGLTRLAAAIGAIAVQDTIAGGALQPQLDELRQRATALQQEPTATTHALQTREAFMIAASLIANMRERRFPNLAAESAGVTDAAKAIQAERPLLDQKSEVQQFFGRAGAALRGMTTTS